MPAHKLPPGEARTERLALRLTEDEHTAVAALAEAAGVPPATYVQNLLHMHLVFELPRVGDKGKARRRK